MPGLDLGVGRGGGYYHNENKELRLSHIGDTRGHTYLNANSPDIGAGGKTTIAGAQLFGRSVNGLTQDLTIISPQERGREQGKSWHWNVSSDPLAMAGSLAGNYGKIQGNYASVNGQSGLRDTPAAGRLDESLQQHNAAYNAEHGWRSGQSGIFAGDDGFNIENQGELQLGGGIITSTQTAEDKGNNRLVTDTIKVWDVKNHSNSSVVAVSGQLSASYGNDGLQLGRSLGPAGRRQNASNTSYGAVGTRNITIRDDAGQRVLTGESGAEAAGKAFKPIWSDSNGGATGSNFQGQKGLASLQAEANITQQASTVGQQFQQKWDGEAEQLRQRYENGEMSATAYKTGLDEINRKKTLMDSAIGALSAPGGGGSVVVGAMSPTVAQTIKANTTPGSLSNALAHGAWGATHMLANGGNGSDALRDALTTGGTELLAPALAQNLYGTSDPQKLTPNQKNNLKVLTGTTAGLIGASNGNPLMGTTATHAADNSLNNNYYFLSGEFVRPSPGKIYYGPYYLGNEEEITEEQAKKIENPKKYQENKIKLVKACTTESGTLAKCGEEIRHVIDFINFRSDSEEFIKYQEESRAFLKRNHELVIAALKAYEHSENNSIKNRYVRPLLDMGIGGAEVVGGVALEIIGAPIVLDGIDNFRTGWKNLGLAKDKHYGSLIAETVTTFGGSEEAANLTKFGFSMFPFGITPKITHGAYVNKGLLTADSLNYAEKAEYIIQQDKIVSSIASKVPPIAGIIDKQSGAYANSTKNLSYPSSGNGVGYNRFAPNNNFSTPLNPTARSTRVYAANSALVSKEVEKLHSIKLNVLQRGRVKELKSQFNPTHIKPQDIELKFNGKIYKADANDSKYVPVFHNVSDENAITYFKELVGIENLPPPLTIANKFDIHGNPAKVWTVKPAKGPFKGTALNLRNFSTSQDQIPTKLTIEIVRGKNINKSISGLGYNSIEIKFVDK